MSGRSASLYVRSLPEAGLKAHAAVKREVQDSRERALIEAAQRDRGRFADLYEANFERVYAYVARRVRDRAALRRPGLRRPVTIRRENMSALRSGSLHSRKWPISW